MMVAVDFSPRTEGVFWSRVAERRLKATALSVRSAVAPRRRVVCSPRSVGSSPRLPSLSRSARPGENVQTPRAGLELCAPMADALGVPGNFNALAPHRRMGTYVCPCDSAPIPGLNDHGVRLARERTAIEAAENLPTAKPRGPQEQLHLELVNPAGRSPGAVCGHHVPRDIQHFDTNFRLLELSHA